MTPSLVTHITAGCVFAVAERVEFGGGTLVEYVMERGGNRSGVLIAGRGDEGGFCHS